MSRCPSPSYSPSRRRHTQFPYHLAYSFLANILILSTIVASYSCSQAGATLAPTLSPLSIFYIFPCFHFPEFTP